jgi:hypothetical protein
MNTMLTIAELLAGEALVSPGGPVDGLTAAADDYALGADPTASATAAPEDEETVRPLIERVLLPI